MSPKATEGVGSTGLSLLTTERGWRFTRGDPLWPAGHLPLKGGDYAFASAAFPLAIKCGLAKSASSLCSRLP